MIDSIFWFCVMLIQWLGEVTGLGYNLTNLALFVVLQPALIIVFFILWRREVGKRYRD